MAVKEISNNLFFANVESIINSGNSVELKVKGTSMYPALRNGKHKVVLVPYRKEFLRIGIIALFIHNQKHILHRLVSIDNNILTFQGDNLPYVKEYIEEKDIIAIVEFIITPDGKVTDCKKQWFFIKNKLWRPIYKNHILFMRKIKSLFYKAFVISN
ncbi:S24/S26 family peptidase [Prevotella sp. 10(H)]|uniref:S24/S26 family peptidase n=1 Tax=Prevotella sp. 10(H) TaxID=1158294 RepID=UPI0004A738EF|nr:S24/S26 family peptidase [Prevotella sp. 10(H)]